MNKLEIPLVHIIHTVMTMGNPKIRETILRLHHHRRRLLNKRLQHIDPHRHIQRMLKHNRSSHKMCI